MKPYHVSCGSTNLSFKTILIRKGRGMFYTEMHVCNHCQKIIESYEVHKPDRRLFKWHIKGVDNRVDLAIK